jgi:hypothetical protein
MMTSFMVLLVKSERILAITYCNTLLYCTIVHNWLTCDVLCHSWYAFQP